MSNSFIDRKLKYRLHLLICLLVLCSLPFHLVGQEKPPKPITLRVKSLSVLQFGAFTQGSSGGTVILTAQNARSSTGDVILLNLAGFSYAPAIMQVQALKGTVVSIATGLNGALLGPSGNMNLVIGQTYPPSPFVITTDANTWMDIQVGATLYVGSPGANPPGSYIGTVNIVFNQE